MKLVSCVTLVSSVLAFDRLPTENDLSFSEWKQKFDINFSTAEDRIRVKHFLRTKEFIRDHNDRYHNGLESYHVGLNKFAAMPNSEFASLYLSPRNATLTSEYQCPESYSKAGSHPSSFSSSDVTSVKDQGQCGSCWTFAASAAIEGAFCKKGKQNCKSWNGMSEQEILDCCSSNSALNPYNNNGCNGGFSSNAMRCVAQFVGGVENYNDYGYTGKQGNCNYKSSKSIGNISNCGRLGKSGDEDLLCAMIYNKGVSAVAIDASGLGFQTYSGGVYSSNSCSSRSLNHAVTATGYGKTDGTNTFTIKNSWGSSWGANGYIYFERKGHNMCGVASEGQYAIM